MTSIFFDPAQFGPPSEPESREQLIVNGRYYLPPIGDPTGKRRSLQRVTNFIKQLSDEAGLVKWKLRSVVEGLVLREDLYDLACSLDLAETYERDQIIERCIDAAKAFKGSGGNETGTALHNYTDDTGKQPMRVRAKWAPRIENYREALHKAGLRVVPGLSERLVVSERYGTCGRLDDVYEDPYGTLRVGDRKSQKEFYTWWEIGAQLALYQCSDAMWNEQTSSWEDMPKLAGDYAHVAWMPLQHPAAQKGGDVDAVTIYDLPLEVPREVLDWCARVRELRTGARRWGQERPDLDDFARTARDIRDAETLNDLMKINDEVVPRFTGWPDELRAMAAKRWEEIEAQPKPEPVATPLNDAVHVTLTSAARFDQDRTELTVTGTHDAVAKFTEQVQIAPSPDMLNFVDNLTQRAGLVGVPVDSPAGQQARLAIAEGDLHRQQYEGSWQEFAAMFGPPSPLIEPIDPDEMPIGQVFPIVPTPDVLAACEEESRAFIASQTPPPRAQLFGQAPQRLAVQGTVSRDQLHPVATATFTHARHEDATVVELPTGEGDSSPGWDPVKLVPLPTSATDRETAIEALDSVPIKVVREICTRANNSQTSRGRVRLLNDVEEGKYAAHGVELVPALLREWLEIDRGPISDTGCVKNTGGSKRKPMEASEAGSISLTDYLATKGEGGPVAAAEGSAAPAQGDDVQLKDSVDISKAITLPARAAEIEGAVERFMDEVAEVRKPYRGLSEGENAGKHSMLRLIELAKDARNGAERAKVFHEITRRKAWTGEVAAEINQHYLDNGYATENFDPWFEATALPTGSVLAPVDLSPNGHSHVATQNWMDGPHYLSTSPAEAIAQLQACTTQTELQAKWESLAKQPCWSDDAVQEAAYAMLAKIKS